LVWIVLAFVLSPASAAGQEWETFSASRRVGDATRLDVRVRYGAGQFTVRPAESGILYDVRLEYDASQFDPVLDFDGERLELGTETRGRNINVGDDAGEMILELSREVRTELLLEFGAVRADLDLGGMTLTELDLQTGASESTVDFSAPNRTRMRSAELQVGAADFTATNLGNLNADRLDFSAGVGEVVLDFGGEWSRDLEVQVAMGLGSLELRIPEDIGVRLNKDSFLTSLDAPALVKDGDRYYSKNWDEADRRMTIDIDAAFGSIRILRTR
jgi:hypothetical protein